MFRSVALKLFQHRSLRSVLIQAPFLRLPQQKLSGCPPQVLLHSKAQKQPRRNTNDPDTFGTISPEYDSKVEKVSKEPLEVKDTKDPDTFGTISPEYAPRVDKVSKDPLDIKEEKFLESTKPVDRKSAHKYGEEMKILINKGRLKEALDIYENVLPQENVKPDVHVYGILIGGCGRSGNTKQAFRLYNQMKKRNLRPTEGVYTALFNACANARRPEDGLQRATKLREQLIDKGKVFNIYQYHAMIKAFGRCGDLQTAFQLVDDMVAHSITPNSETFSFLLQSCISDSKEGFKLALKVWQKMRKYKISPDVFLYNLVLRSVRDCSIGEAMEQETLKLSEPQQPTQLLESLALTLPKSVLVNYDDKAAVLPECASVINLLDEKPQLRGPLMVQDLSQPSNRLKLVGGAMGFLRAMTRDQVQPDIKTFSQLLEVIPSSVEAETNLLLLMSSHNVKPDVDFFNMLIKKRNYRKDFRNAKDVLKAIEDHNLYPDVCTFGVLALGCRSWKDCSQLLESMDLAGFRINVQILGTLLKNAIVRRDCWYLNELLQKAADLNLTLDPTAINLLESFREKVASDLAKQDRGEFVSEQLDDPRFRESYRVFCLSYKRWMSQIGLETDF